MHYHANNGRFAETLWKADVNAQGQTQSLCGVNAHFQNGVAKKRIRDLTKAARTAIIHAQKRWPDAVNAHLWPYALRLANMVHNEVPDIKRKMAPMQLFSKLTASGS